MLASDFALGNFGVDTLGIPGTNGATSYADDPRYAGFPSFNPGFSAIGNNAGWNPLVPRRAHVRVLDRTSPS